SSHVMTLTIAHTLAALRKHDVPLLETDTLPPHRWTDWLPDEVIEHLEIKNRGSRPLSIYRVPSIDVAQQYLLGEPDQNFVGIEFYRSHEGFQIMVGTAKNIWRHLESVTDKSSLEFLLEFREDAANQTIYIFNLSIGPLIANDPSGVLWEHE